MTTYGSAKLTLPLVAERWPNELAPDSCTFQRVYNNVEQSTPHSRRESIVIRGRPLWMAKLTWKRNSRTDAKQVDVWLDGLFGGVGSVMLWDFKRPYPANISAANTAESGGMHLVPIVPLRWVAGGAYFKWIGPSGESLYWDSGQPIRGSKTILIWFPASVAGQTILERGDRIQLKRRLYVVKDDVVAENGNTVVELTSPILDDLVLGDECRIIRASVEMRLATINETGSASRAATHGFETFSASFIETTSNYAVGGLSFAP